ncbi:MAG: hypothetical protein JSV77_00755 [Dehalococcoidales bacterium]|nr:MAG: hypothetical protein JSV77_00755 [Dehalococcoidales bacterium]
MAVDGTYNIEVETPMGNRPGKLTLKADGGSLSGSVDMGMGGEQAFSEGTVAGDEATWSISVSGPMGQMKLDFKVTVTGDDVSGQVQLGSFGTGNIKGKRA